MTAFVPGRLYVSTDPAVLYMLAVVISVHHIAGQEPERQRVFSLVFTEVGWRLMWWTSIGVEWDVME